MKSHLGHYEIVGELGRGGMGVVYKGYEPSLARYVAIKELSPALAHDPSVVERFLREARSMALLNDPHIIQIYSIGQENDLPFFVMEFVDGISVAALIQRDHHLQPPDALKIVHQTAQGLSAAHDRGVIHRDVKPANLMVSQRGQVKIADFGIALANADMNAKLTSVGEMVGTPGYLPPELLLGHAVDQRSDVYALGVALFEMLTGRTPFSDASVYKLMLDVVQTEVPDIREINAEIDPGVAAILARMLVKDPSKRYQSMHELIADLEKHPLVAQGGSIKLKLSPSSTSTETQVSLAIPMTPASGIRRAPTAPPVMGRAGPVPTPRNAAPATAASAGAPTPTAIRTTPVHSPAAPAAPGAAIPGKSRRWPLLMASLLVVLVLGGTWLLRGQLFGPTASGDTAVDVAGPDAGQPDAALTRAWFAQLGRSSQAAFLDARKSGINALRPLLKQLGVSLSSELVFNVLLLLLLVLVFRNISHRISRARARRAYARRTRNPA